MWKLVLTGVLDGLLTFVAALAALQRKKILEKDLDKWTNTRNTIEQEVFALENANINLETMKAMKAGADAMKGILGPLYLPQAFASVVSRM